MENVDALEFNTASGCGDGACAEVAFVKSSQCGDSACVEAGTASDLDEVYLRNSTLPGVMVAIPKEAWRGFINEIRNGTTLIASLDD